ncbi:MAG: ABC transporter permease [Dehalococcoidia bacterium]|nr:ABC transporter permease [Dehalococcoidia bacterium]
MNKTLIIFRHELLVTIRRKSFILITLAAPLLMLLGYGIYQAVQNWYHPSEPETAKIGYVDEAGGFDEYTDLGANLVAYPEEEAARQSLLSGEIGEYFVIPRDYVQTGRIIRYTTKRELEPPPETVENIKAFLISNLIGDTTAPDILERAKTPILLSSVRLDDAGEPMKGQNPFVQFFMPYVLALLLIFSIFFASGYLLQSISEEKDNRLMEVLLSSVSARQLLVGKVLGLGAAGLFQILVWVVSLWVLVDVGLTRIPSLTDASLPPGLVILAVIYYVLGYLLFAVIMAVLGSMGTTAREAQSWSSIVVMTAVLPTFFLNLIVENPDHIVAILFTFIPTTASVTAMMRLPTEGIPAWQLALSLSFLVAAIAFCMWAGAKIFRASLLIYGKRPNLRQIVRYVREA